MSDIVARLVRFDGKKCVSSDVEVEAATIIEKLLRELDEAQKALRIVQNAAKTIAKCNDTELQHLRDNAKFDHHIRAEHESLIERDEIMTKALEKAETERDALRALLREAGEALEPFANSLRSYHAASGDARLSGVNPRVGDLRRARAVLAKIKGEGECTA